MHRRPRLSWTSPRKPHPPQARPDFCAGTSLSCQRGGSRLGRIFMGGLSGAGPASSGLKLNRPRAGWPDRTQAAAATDVAEAALSDLPQGCERAPFYEPDWWNDAGAIQRWNNCYNYATNERTDTFAQPGRAAGFSIDRRFLFCPLILDLATRDQ